MSDRDLALKTSQRLNFYPFEISFLGATATRIINKSRVNRVVYHVRSKPPGTIERVMVAAAPISLASHAPAV